LKEFIHCRGLAEKIADPFFPFKGKSSSVKRPPSAPGEGRGEGEPDLNFHDLFTGV
jgi:hypothetical protein